MSWHREGLGDRCWPARMGGWASQFFHPCHGQGCAHCQGRSCPWHEVHLRGHKVHLWGCRLGLLASLCLRHWPGTLQASVLP